MDERLLAWKGRRRRESCPPRVLAKVRRRIAAERPPASVHWRRWSLATAAVVVLALFLREETDPKLPPPTLAGETPAEVVEETEFSLACLGYALLQAGRSSSRIILAETLPPLRQGLDTARKSIVKPTTTESSTSS